MSFCLCLADHKKANLEADDDVTGIDQLYSDYTNAEIKKDMNETSESMVWREIDFSNNLCRNYPEQFMQIYRYENKKCNALPTRSGSQKHI